VIYELTKSDLFCQITQCLETAIPELVGLLLLLLLLLLMMMMMLIYCSMFALKDESYLRQTLQRQTATLHQAAVSYAVSKQQFTFLQQT